MANFVYNPHSGENPPSQWKRYLQQGEFSSDLTSAIHSQTKVYQTEIQRASDTLGSSLDHAVRIFFIRAPSRAGAAIVS